MRLPALAQATQAAFQNHGSHHPIIDQILTLIEQRCAQTIRNLTAPQAAEPPPAFT